MKDNYIIYGSKQFDRLFVRIIKFVNWYIGQKSE
jgi:hypothetical protein